MKTMFLTIFLRVVFIELEIPKRLCDIVAINGYFQASNFERFIYEIFDRDSKYVSALWAELGKNNSFSIDAQSLTNLKREWDSFGCFKTCNRIDTIQRVYESNQLVVDPHTADGIYVERDLLKTIFQ